MRRLSLFFLTTLAIVALPAVASAQSAEPLTPEAVQFWLNNLWVLVSAFMVFLMHLGFAALESGLTRAKNTVNILFKNVTIVAIGLLTYYFIGFRLMYPGADFAGAWFGMAAMMGPGEAGQTMAYGDYTYWTDFIFQAVFAATAATIVSGAVAERMKLGVFLGFSTFLVAILYPMVGMWKWGGGFLDAHGFYDFAGSTIVHSVGGWAALAAVIVLGARDGKYRGGRVVPIMGHNMPLATIGVFLLWFGWYGFNGGSVLNADPAALSHVVVTTSLSAAAGVLVAAGTSRVVMGTPDLSMALNGALAGLVGITAGADVIAVPMSIVVGAVSGVLVVLAVIGLERLRLDDPVGAIPVHLVNGVWGTLAVGLFSAEHSLGAQALGVALTGVFVFGLSMGVLLALRATVGLRVSRQEERIGLDIEEHGMEAYAGFQFFITQ